MRKLLIIIMILPCFFGTVGSTEAKSVLTCVNEKMNALKRVNKSNAKGMLYAHFSIKSLAIASYGGAAKWKANPQDHKKVLARFEESKRITALAKGLQAYKTAKVQKVFANEKARSAVVIAKTSGPIKATVRFVQGSCTIAELCIENKGCASQIFR